MRPEASRPVLLVLTLLLVAGAVAFLEFQLGEATPGESQAAVETEQTTVEQTTREQTTEEQATGGRTTESPSAGDTAEQTAAAPEQGMTEEQRETVDRISAKEAEFERAPEITGPTGFVNTDGITLEEFEGEEVVLLEFWTYSCYNCQNVQPYLNAWHDEYADEGLQIIGVHKPEFEFEKDPANVREAVGEAGIEYPVVLDNNDATWDAYGQRYWPTMYLIDSDGFIRYRHIGEGAYQETEAKIRELLAEREG